MPFNSMEDFRRQMQEAMSMSEMQKQAQTQSQIQDYLSERERKEALTKGLLNMVLDFMPGIGDIKGVGEAVVGKTALGEPLNWWERGLSAAGALPIIPSVTGLVKTKWTYPLIDVIRAKMPKSARARDVMNMVRGGGVKKDEILWSGVEDYLRGKDKVEKADLLSYLEKNKVELNEITKKGPHTPLTLEENRELEALYERYYHSSITNRPLSDVEITRLDYLNSKSQGPTKFSSPNLNLPGGENYREMLVQMPVKERQATVMERRGYGAEVEDLGVYKSSHWDEPNPLFHIRYDDRVDAQGKKMLFLEEVQSDWHQAGRERGYAQPKYILYDKVTNEPIAEFDTLEDVTKAGKDYFKSGHPEGSYHFINKEGVPPAPLSKSWHETALRRAVREAVEGGYEKIGWTTGEQQAKRYNLSKWVDRIVHYKTGEDKYYVFLYPKGQTGYATDPKLARQGVPLSEVENFVGKDITEKIAKGEGKRIENGIELSGLDIKVGGEGMKGFYDKMLVDYMNAFGKKYGVRVTDTEIPGSGAKTYLTEGGEFGKELKIGKNEIVHSIDIPPQMRKDVIEKGLPLFSIPALSFGAYQAWKAEKGRRQEVR